MPEQREERWRLFFYTAHYHTNWSVSTRPSHFTNLPLPTHFTILQLCIIFKLVVENIPKMSILDYLIPSYFIILHLPSYNICQTVNTQSPPTQYFLVLENGENLLLHRMQCLVIAVFLLSVLSSNAKPFI